MKPLYEQGQGLIFLDKEKTKPSVVNDFLTCRDGTVEMIEFREESGYGGTCRFFKCVNYKHEIHAMVFQGLLDDGGYIENYIISDSDSFSLINKVLHVKGTDNKGVILYRDFMDGK